MAVYTYTTEVTKSIFKFSSPSNYLFELASFSFNQSSGLYLEVEDYGLISQLSIGDEDYGSITGSPTSYADYNLISVDTSPAYGLVKNIVSTSIVKFRIGSIGGIEFSLQGGSYEGFGSPFIGYGGVSSISGGLSLESFVSAPKQGAGTLFALVSKKEKTTFSYNSSAVVLKVDDDYGFISQAINDQDSYGSVAELVNRPDSEDYGNLTTSDQRPFGSLKFVGTPVVGFRLRYIGSGSLFAFTGSGEAVAPAPEVGSTLFSFSGSATEKSSPATEVGSGTLFSFIRKEERRTYNYNTSAQISIEDNDFGFISQNHTSFDDYGAVNELINRTDSEDYGNLTTSDQRPFGFFNIFGDAAKTTRFRLRYIGSGSLFAFTGSGEAVAPAPEVGSTLFTFAGAATEKTSPATVIGSGTLFSFIRKEERRTYSYNTSAQYIVADEDFGSISEQHTDSDDLGVVSELVNRSDSEDYGDITAIQRRPFGFFNITGTSFESNIPAPYVGSGSLFAFIGASESTSSAPKERASLIKFLGSAIEKASVGTEVGSGTLFNFITKEERRTYSYNGSSVVGGSASVEDYGIISESHFSSDDYGSITEPYYFRTSADYGYLTDSIETRIPYGRLRFSSASLESVIPNYVGTGSLFTFIGGAESISPAPEIGYSLGKFSGSAKEQFGKGLYTGSGTLFNFVTKEERRTYSYNGSSIVTRENYDYGIISSSHQTDDDYGFIVNDISTGYYDDYGFITGGREEKRPYGGLRFSGTISQQYTAIVIGSGSLFAFGGSASSVLPSEFGSGLFRFSGAVTEKNTESYVGTGSLFTFIGGAESTSTSESAIGLFELNGSAVIRATNKFDGSGSLFAFIGAGESTAVVPPITTPPITGFLRFNGSAAESTTPATEIGSGSLFTFVSFTETTSVSEFSSGLFKFTGTLRERNTEAYRGTGTLSAFTGAAESRGVVPPSIGLLKLRSGTTESFGKGLYTASGYIPVNKGKAIYDPEDKVRIASATESFIKSSSILGGPIKVQGEVGRIFFQYGERGEGRFTIAGEAIIKTNPIHFGGGFVNVRGTGKEAIVPATEIGSGTLFTFVNGKEATVPATEIGSGKFKLFGAATNIKEIDSEVGSGILFRININTGVLIEFRYPVTGTIPVTGTAGQRKLDSYTGSGQIRPIGEVEDYFSNKFFSAGDPIRIRRTDTPQSISRQYSGSGSLFAFVSGTEATGANPPERTTLLRFSGSASESRLEKHIGSGTITQRQATAVGGITLDLSDATISEFANEIIANYLELPINAIRSIVTGEEPKQRIIAAIDSASFAPPVKDKAIEIKGTRQRESVVPSNFGTGNLFGFGSSAESAAFVPAKTTELFRFTGNLQERATNNNIGSGSLFGFGNSAESFFAATPTEPRPLKFVGTVQESFVPAPHIGSGTISAFVGASESTAFSPETRTLFTFSGNADTVKFN